MENSNNSGRLEKKVALITGAGRGIGRSIAIKYAQQGADLFLCATRQETLRETEKLISKYEIKTELYPMDVRNRKGVEKMVQQSISTFGKIDILVNNAGIHRGGLFQDFKLKDFDDVMQVNVYGNFHVTQFVLKYMLERNSGKIINIASTAGKWPSYGQSPYNASKHALIGLTRCLALELGQQGITVNAICPGFVNTDMVNDSAKVYGISKEQIIEMVSQKTAMNKIIQPDEVADLAVYLASDDANSITGQSIVIDGGMVFV